VARATEALWFFHRRVELLDGLFQGGAKDQGRSAEVPARRDELEPSFGEA